jgi:hypothetical protein
MEVEVALNIIGSLSDGINPETGEAFNDESCFNNSQVLRALAVAKQVLENTVRLQNRKSNLPNNAGKPWKKEDDLALESSFDGGLTLNELCEKYERTQSSIKARLVRLGKINERSDIQ